MKLRQVLKGILFLMVVFIFLSVFNNVAAAQITDLRFIGRAVYRLTGQTFPISDVSATLIGNNNAVLGTGATDSDGNFEIRIPHTTACDPLPTYRVELSSSVWTFNGGGGTIIGCLNPGYHSFGDLTMIRVLSVTFENNYADQISTNPNAGLGKRIYPDKQSPSDNTINRRVVRVCAQTTSRVAVAIVHFKVFDLDDPSSNETAVDSNGATANDNRGTDSSPVRNSMTSEDEGVGQDPICVDFTVTMHPGDNFAIAASTDYDYLYPAIADGADVKDASGNVITITSTKAKKAYRTDMLTIWRRLHVEVDSMGVVTNNKVIGTIIGAISTQAGVDIIVDSTLEEYRFEPGTIVVNQVGTFSVLDNTENLVKTNAAVAPATLVGKSFTLYDDDDFNGDDATDNGDDMDDVSETSATFLAMQSNDEPGKNIFGAAYIMPIYDGGGSISNNTSNIPFVLNLSGSQALSQIGLGRNSGSVESDNFWVIYFQVAYQPEIEFDRDPNTDRGWAPVPSTLGGTPTTSVVDIVPSNCSNMPLGGHGSFAFQEVIRDEHNVAA